MTYNELLQQKEWWSKCNEILSRDHYTCKDCGCMGYHNGGSFIKLDHIEEMDAMLKDWRFYEKKFSDFWNVNQNEFSPTIEEKYDKENSNEVDFSDFWNDILDGYPTRIKDIRAKKELSEADLNIYRLQFENCKTGLFVSPLDVPRKTFLMTTNDLNTLSTKAYYIDEVFISKGSLSAKGTAYLFEFEETMSDVVYLNIELNNGAYFINVTYENRLMSMRLIPDENEIRGLNIHHTYYIEGHKPWEYENEALVTLCEDCHKKRHETSDVPLYDSNKRLISNLVRCDRCGGSGYLPQYSHVEHGRCFKCGGEGVILCEKN